jgi:tartrate-resistant acid phosphatase type 5
VLGVRDGVIQQAKTNTFDFIFAVGDNFYRNGVVNTTDELWHSTWMDRWQIGTNLTLPWVSFMGNHDWNGNAQAQIDYSKSSEAGAKYWIMPSKYYSIDATVPNNKKLKIAVVDTQTINTTAEFDWAAKQFNDSSAEFVLAAGHHQMYSAAKRGDNTDAPMVKLRNMIESSDKVKAYLCGHEHDMQFLRAANKDYFMFGGGGRTMNETEVGPGTAAEIVYFKKKYGFATFDIQLGSRTMVVTYYIYNNLGQVIDTLVFNRQY